MGQDVIWSFVVVGGVVLGLGCRIFDAGGVSCGLFLCGRRDGPKGKEI